ncbi:MAG: NADH-quinone oxidoreductase subunit M, partial [Actinomycetia bacterium]|nr:NADH-quinone oxidoreductase subunit M [Actinomycetes bacterium]
MINWLPTALTFIPLLFTVIIIFMPKEKDLSIKIVALIGTGLALIGSIYMYYVFDFSNPGFQMVKKLPWIGAIGAEYNMAVDGISLPMVLVTTLLTFICVVASWKITHRIKEYMGFMLFLEVGMIGVFFAL